MAPPVKPGDVLAGKYRVDEVLGVGGMGVVVAAEHIDLHQKVALKFMLPEALEDEAGVDRFMREARAAVRLKGEHVARVMDVGRLENGAPYIVMEYLQGGDLGNVIRSRGALPVQEAVTYIMQACMAMAEAHSQGIVHRDLKPENLFLAQRPDGRPLIKVLDFGISKILAAPGEADVSTTKTSTMMGSPAYMAPEQMRSAKHVDARADVWSLGAILYQLVSGVLPFQAETAPEMFAKVLYENPEPLRAFVHVPPELEAVIERCLQKEREQRFESVPEFATALARFGDDNAKSLARFIHKTFFGNKHTAPPIGPVDLPPTALPLKTTNKGADDTPLPTQPARPAAKAAVTVTTHGAATGQVSHAGGSIDDYVPPTAGRGKWIALGVAAVAGVIAIVAITSGGDGGAPAAPAAGPTPVEAAADAAPVAEVAPVDAGVAQVAVAVDAAAIEPASAKVEPPVEPKPAKTARKRPRRTRKETTATTKPAEPTKTAEPPKPPPKKKPPKKPEDDDPFGTIQ